MYSPNLVTFWSPFYSNKKEPPLPRRRSGDSNKTLRRGICRRYCQEQRQLSPFCGDEHYQPRYPLDNEKHAQIDEMLLVSLQNLDNGIRYDVRVVRQAIDYFNAERIITQGAIETKPQSQQTEGDKQNDSVPIVFLCFKQGVSTILLGG